MFNVLNMFLQLTWGLELWILNSSRWKVLKDKWARPHVVQEKICWHFLMDMVTIPEFLERQTFLDWVTVNFTETYPLHAVRENMWHRLLNLIYVQNRDFHCIFMRKEGAEKYRDHFHRYINLIHQQSLQRLKNKTSRYFSFPYIFWLFITYEGKYFTHLKSVTCMLMSDALYNQ
jgi:hypothetical protein